LFKAICSNPQHLVCQVRANAVPVKGKISGEIKGKFIAIDPTGQGGEDENALSTGAAHQSNSPYIERSMPEGNAQVSGGTQTIQRGAALLRLISTNNRTGMRLVDLYRALALERPTAHRLLQGLAGERLVRQDPQSKRYFLGSMIYEMGLAAAPKMPLRDICHPHLHMIAERTEDTVFLTVRSGFDGLCVDRVEGAFPIKVFVLEVGRRRPLNVGGGSLAIMSAMPDAEIERVCKVNGERLRAKFPRYSDSILKERIGLARLAGFALNEVLEVPGVRSIGVPIRDSHGRSIAGVSVATLKERLEPDRVAWIGALIVDAVQDIEAAIASSPSDVLV
jgi:DNA-binding IclR family transcriptional regulator